MPVLATVLSILLLLLLILKWRIPAFLALLIAAIAAGLGSGLDGPAVIEAMQNGMGGTLGFVATVVGLGAMFGALLENAGGAQAIAQYLIRKQGVERAPAAMAFTGFLIAIPVFFDVAFIILIPVLYALKERTGASLLKFALPLLAGLAATHAFIPPTPGPIAVAEIVGADLGWVILLGAIAGLPPVLVSGLWFGQRVARRIDPDPPAFSEAKTPDTLPPVGLILLIIGMPIVLIVLSTLAQSGTLPLPAAVLPVVQFLGHPFTALLLANLLIWYLLGLRRGYSSEVLLKATTDSMSTAGSILLLTGAGGVFKQMLVDTGAGQQIAASMTAAGLPVVVFAFLAAALIRVAQGSATVAMITGASLTAPLLSNGVHFSAGQLGAVVIAIAAGGTVLSHVNDSGFSLVKSYLGLSEKETFRSWTVLTAVLGGVGFGIAALLFYLF